MSNILVPNLNYIDSSFLTSQTYSSQLTAAPATNVYDKVRRSKVWRTQGYWEISASNKGIVFRESVGVNLTANIAELNYTTDSTFITAIKTALDAAGASTYTVTRDVSTNKIKITSDGLGGGGIFQLMWTNVGSTAADVLGFSTAADDTGALNYTADNLRIHTSEWLRWDCGTSVNPQMFAICGGRANGLRLSSSATVTLQGNATDVWTAPTYSQAMTYNAKTMALINDGDGLHSGALRYWRLKIVDRDNPLGYVELSNVYLGEVYEPATGTVQFPFNSEMIDFSTTQDSEWGNTFSDVKQFTESFDLDWFGLTTAEMEILKEYVELYGKRYPFWICADPNMVMSTDFQTWVKPCRFVEMPRFGYVSPGIWSSAWKIREEP